MASSHQAIILNLLFKHGEMFGLEMIRKGNGVLKRGSIYVLLDRLESDGLVKSSIAPTKIGEQGPARRIYRITGSGQKTLKAKFDELRSLGAMLGMEGAS